MAPNLRFVIFALALFTQLGCMPHSVQPEVADRSLASLYQSVVNRCGNLLSSAADKNFDFELFCKTRDQITIGQKLTLENWQQKSPEELMAIIEAFSLFSIGSAKGLEADTIKVSQARDLKAHIMKLQKSKKNQEQKIRDLVAHWYRLTHEVSVQRLLINNRKDVERLFVKISEEKRIQRIEAEIAKRGVIEAFESVGFYSDPTHWQQLKNYLVKKRNEKNLTLAMLFTIPAVTQANLWFTFLPVWDFAKTEPLADRYQEIAFEYGHDKAHEMIREESRTKGTFNSYAKIVSHAVNTAFFAGLIVTVINTNEVRRQAEREVIEMLENPDPVNETPASYMDELAEKTIQDREKQLGRKLSAPEKQRIREQFRLVTKNARLKIDTPQ